MVVVCFCMVRRPTYEELEELYSQEKKKNLAQRKENHAEAFMILTR